MGEWLKSWWPPTGLGVVLLGVSVQDITEVVQMIAGIGAALTVLIGLVRALIGLWRTLNTKPRD